MKYKKDISIIIFGSAYFTKNVIGSMVKFKQL